MSSDHLLLRAVAAHCGMGAIIGLVFFGTMLLFDMFGIRAMIAGTELPLMTLVIFCVVIVSHFAFGAGLTGFLFVVSDGIPDRKDPKR